MGTLALESHLDLRPFISAHIHQERILALRDKEEGRIVAGCEGETLHIEGLGSGVPVKRRKGLHLIQLLNKQQVALVAVRQIERRGIIGTVLEDGQHLVFARELAQVDAPSVLVEFLDIRIVPDIFSADGRDAFRLQHNLLDDVLAHQVTSRGLALDGQFGEVVLERKLLQFRLGPQVHPDRLGLAVVVGRKPEDGRTGRARGDIVFAVAGNARHRKAFRIINRGLSFAINHIVDRARIVAVEYAHVQQVLPKESLVGHLCHAILAVAANDDDLRQVGAVSDKDAVVVPFQADAHEALLHVRVEFGIVVHDLGHGDGLESGNLCLPRVIFPVFLLQALEPVNRVPDDMVDLVAYLGHLLLDSRNLLVDGFGIEARNLADRFLHQPVDILHHNVPAHLVAVFLHLGKDGFFLVFPGREVLAFQQFINAVLEEDAFQRRVMPIVFELAQPDAEFLFQQVLGVVGIVNQDIFHREELRFVVHNHARIRVDGGLAVRKGIQGVDGLVR